MITITNYLENTANVDFTNLPSAFANGDKLTRGEANNDWSAYKQNETIKRVVDSYIEKLNDYLKKNPQSTKSENVKTGHVKKKKADQPETKSRSAKKAKTEKVVSPKKIKKIKKKVKPYNNAIEVTELNSSVKIIKRFLQLSGKHINKIVFIRLLKALQKAIELRQIRKDDEFAVEILDIQNYLVKAVNAKEEIIFVSISDNKIEEFSKAAYSVKESQAVKLVKKFLTLYSQPDKEKAGKLLLMINKAISEGQIPEESLSSEHIDLVTSAIVKYQQNGTLYIPEFALTGLSGFADNELSGLGVLDRLLPNAYKTAMQSKMLNQKNTNTPRFKKNLSKRSSYSPYAASFTRNTAKVSRVNQPTSNANNNNVNPNYYNGGGGGGSGSEIYNEPEETDKVNSTELKNKTFKTVGFTGEWKNLIGDPSEPFTMMLFGSPGSGKSTLAIMLAHYLASEHDKKVAYIAKEEGVGYTLKEKFERVDAYHENIDLFIQGLPDEPSDYDYLFMDSVNELGFNSEELKELTNYYADNNVSFVGMFQGTKTGSYRGSQEYEHNVDVSINCENGTAFTKKSRFGGNGEMEIYEKD